MKTIIGIMGPGKTATKEVVDFAESTGALLAKAGYVVLSGGRSEGVMQAAMKGASEAGGVTVGILPGNDIRGMSEFVDIPVFTGMGNARNAINVLSSQVVVAVGIGTGTASEVSIALKMKKPVVLAGMKDDDIRFFQRLGKLLVASKPEEVLAIIQDMNV